MSVAETDTAWTTFASFLTYAVVAKKRSHFYNCIYFSDLYNNLFQCGRRWPFRQQTITFNTVNGDLPQREGSPLTSLLVMSAFLHRQRQDYAHCSISVIKRYFFRKNIDFCIDFLAFFLDLQYFFVFLQSNIQWQEMSYAVSIAS